MKKRQKKLTLHRETLRRLETGSLWRVRGGVAAAAFSGEDTCGMCDSILSCTEVEEDCCVGTN
jgi:hypothetical protein